MASNGAWVTGDPVRVLLSQLQLRKQSRQLIESRAAFRVKSSHSIEARDPAVEFFHRDRSAGSNLRDRAWPRTACRLL